MQFSQLREEVHNILVNLQEEEKLSLIVPHGHSLPQAMIADHHAFEAYRELAIAVDEELYAAGIPLGDEKAHEAFVLSDKLVSKYFGEFLPKVQPLLNVSPVDVGM